VLPTFHIRDSNAKECFDLRHGLVKAKIPPSHREIVQENTSKLANEILERVVSLLTSVYPKWVFQPDNLSPEARERAATLSDFARSIWLDLEDRAIIPLFRFFVDQQLASGGAVFKVLTRFDRWGDLPDMPGMDESARAFKSRVDNYKAGHIPFDIIIPEYSTIYYDLTVEGMTRVLESKRASVYELADQFGGRFDEDQKTLHIPVDLPIDPMAYQAACDAACMEEGVESVDDLSEEAYDAIPTTVTHDLTINTQSREVEYMEYWVKGQWCVYSISDIPVRVDYLEADDKIPYFLGLGPVTASPDPGRMGLPLLYNVFEAFKRKLNLRAMEDAFLYKHGFARMIHYTHADSLAGGRVGVELPDQEEEEEQIGEILDAVMGKEDWKYLVPANVTALFSHAMEDTDGEIENAALADILAGKLPPSGTTGYLMSQLQTAATSKYVPILTQAERALRAATLYILDQIDKNLSSDVVVRVQTDETSIGAFISYKPGDSKGNRNLYVTIEAPLPSDQLQKTQWLTMGNQQGYVSRERVQREGYRIDKPGMEDDTIMLEQFDKMYRPFAMMKAIQRVGRMDEFIQMAQQGLLPPELVQLAQIFASGPDQQQPSQGGTAGMGPAAITGNPNGVLSPTPGQGEPGQPTTGASANSGGMPEPIAPTVAGNVNQPTQPMTP
jgi:hypothetical protein